MDRNNHTNLKNKTLTHIAKRAATLLCAALAGLTLAHSAAAQNIPQTNSPATPTPYQSPLFHGGGSDPTLLFTPPFLNPFYGQLQGTPTATVPNGASVSPVQIPSFVFGAYNPAKPPTSGLAYYPEHLADGDIYQWQAPFNYVSNASGLVTIDDTAPAPAPVPGNPSGFVLNNSGNWEQQTSGDAAGTATGGEYYRLMQGLNGSAVWTLSATVAGTYSVYFHIPDNIPDSAGNVEPRSAQVTYQITVSGANSQNGSATVSQTEANSSQFLAGPFLLAIGDTVTVTLQRDASHNQNSSAASPKQFLIADAMTLQTAIGDVRSTPTAINADAYPNEFKSAKFWGIYTPPGAVTPTNGTASGTTILQSNAPEDNSLSPAFGGTPVIRYGDPAKLPAETVLGPKNTEQHRIRQLVYFGRQEPTYSNGRTVDDSNTAGTANFFQPNGWTATTDTTGTATGTTYTTHVGELAGGPSAVWSLTAPNGGDYFVTVHLPATPNGEKRIPDAAYTLSVNGVALTTQPPKISQQTGTAARDVTLATGGISLNAGDVLTVSLADTTALTPSTSYTLVADSVRISTGGQGAIYCVDGFTGGVLWRYQTAGPSLPVFAAPVVTKINVLVAPPTATTAAVYQNRLVVIVGDNNGYVYCLDAMGNGDGTSNEQAINPNTGQPIYIPQPAYAPFTGTNGLPTNAPTPVDDPNYTVAPNFPHVGTTGVYWIYRPDANRPKYAAVAAGVPVASVGTVKRDNSGNAIIDPTSDLPVPASFNMASPNIFVDPNVPTAEVAGSIPLITKNGKQVPPTNAIVYIGNSNGVLYAFDAVGAAIDGTTTATYEATGDRFNASIDLRRNLTEGIVPTPQALWWFSLRGAGPNSTDNSSSADIESAPAIYTATKANAAQPTGFDFTPTVYIGSAHELESTSSLGRLYALNGLYGPAGSSGASDPTKQPDPTLASYTGPGSQNYNLAQRPQINNTDATDWSFPDAYDTTATGPTRGGIGKSSDHHPRPALGDVSGSPVVFTDTSETKLLADGVTSARTRIYFAANTGLEIPYNSTATVPSARPDDTETGRIWAVNLDGSMATNTNSGPTGPVWSYPQANNPNDVTKDKVAEPQPPVGSFLHATPAIGYIQFPSQIDTGTGVPYTPKDSMHPGGIKGQIAPMLYAATRGVNDTALYAVDIDGGNDGDRLIYRQISPDGSLYESSPALVANTSVAAPPGNGGSVYVVAGNSLYDFSATPISNPIGTEGYPLIRENRFYVGFGPLSSPTLASASVADLFTSAQLTASGFTTAVTDWIYVGDSTTGFCRGITPFDNTDPGIPPELGGIVPPTVDSATAGDLKAIMQVYLVSEANRGSQHGNPGSDALPVGVGATLPVYDWGQNIYIRFKNVVPPPDANGTPSKYVVDATAGTPSPTNPVTAYGSGGPITFTISDTTDGAQSDTETVPAVLLATATIPLANGFINRLDSDPATNLVDYTTQKGYIGAFTYAIGDGSAKRNTPGATRHIIGAQQVVKIYTFDGTTYTPTNQTTILSVQATNGNVVPKLDTTVNPPVYKTNFDVVQPVDEPIFGILNPLALRGGGIPIAGNVASASAVSIGSELGPFRGVKTGTPDGFVRQALTNGNNVLAVIPDSTSNVGTVAGDPTKRTLSVTSPDSTEAVVATSTGLIPHNTGADNLDALGKNPVDPIGSYNSSTNGLPSAAPFGLAYAPYALDLFDRSNLGVVGQRLRVKTGTVSGGGDGLYWNDNSANLSGHDSVVNFLPWETTPVGYRIGANPSIDYPDISPSHISAMLHPHDPNLGAADLTLGTAYATPAAPNGADSSTRFVYANPIQFHIDIPRFQPANQQVYQRLTSQSDYNASGEAAPLKANGSNNLTGDYIFPMGYVTSRRIYVPDQAGFYREGAAYRIVSVYTGVPPDFGMQMGANTVDIGLPVPSAFGVQTGKYNPPTYPYATGSNADFNPYNIAFHDYYQPLPILNTGNVNLMNVHLDQQIGVGNNAPLPLPLLSDSVDSLSLIPAWDIYGVTGKNNFLLRSSLDSDIAVQNPFFAANGYGGQYPGPTFHKSRVGDANPAQMTVPDVPHDNFGPYAFSITSPVAGDDKPQATATGNPPVLTPVFAAPPYVSVAVPFGTPVGTYHVPKTIQAFEGYDNPAGYSFLYPPFYNGILPGQGKTSNAAALGYLITPTPPTATGPFVKGAPFQHPVSANGTDIKVSVVESRMTDGFTYGAIPMVDAGPAAPPANGNSAHPTPDFAPAGFRDPLTGNLSMYWTTGRNGGFSIQAANVTMNPTAAVPSGVPFFQPVQPGEQSWWSNSALSLQSGTNSGLTIAQDAQNQATIYGFVVNVNTPPYANTLWSYQVAPDTGTLSAPLQVTNDPNQVKYGVKGLSCKSSGFTRTLWAFWTTTVRGRTAINYNSLDPNTSLWVPAAGANAASTIATLPVPAGLTAVANPAPLLLYGNVAGASGPQLQATIAVTYSGTGPDGNIDLYESRYQPDSKNSALLDLVPYPSVTETMVPVTTSGWLQARDVAWSRTGALNLFVSNGTATPSPLLYDTANKPLFSRAVFDKASGYLVLTGIKPTAAVGGYTLFTNVPTGGTITAYVDLATGRVRFTGTPTGTVTANFNPLARRITNDSRADTNPVTFLDGALKANDTLGGTPVKADRRWYIWRKSGTGGAAPSATIYYKTQRLTAYLPSAVDVTKSLTLTLNGISYTGPVDMQVIPPTLNTNGTVKYPSSTRLFFPIQSGAEGQTFTANYTDTNGNSSPTITDVVQWQDEIRANDAYVPPTNAIEGLNIIEPGYAVPLANAVNEDNVSAFLDTEAYNNTLGPPIDLSHPHKVWLFWNSTRNGTADVYYETINPLFAAAP